MINLIIFVLLSIPILLISWKSLTSIKNHGFYRFLSWECILWLAINNIPYWFHDPLSLQQVISWIILILSIYFVVSGAVLLKKAGKPEKTRDEKNLYEFEKTTQLVKNGIFKYIRHPLYASLLFLTWGIYLKNTSIDLLLVAFLSSIFLHITAKLDEKECVAYFGEEYKQYMSESKM
ncbi:methyltransferase family protein, partial [Bacteroidota bacterium]